MNVMSVGKPLIVQTSYIQHQKIGSDEILIQCKDCGKAFTVLVQLTRHQNIHAGKKNSLKCE